MNRLIKQFQVIIDGESDIEERARLNSIVSGAHLANGDPVLAIEAARKAAVPHRTIEAYCRIVAAAIEKSATRAAAEYGLHYSSWPEPSLILRGSGNMAFRDAFGPQRCEAIWPIDRR